MLFLQRVFITLLSPLEGNLFVAILSNAFSFILSCRLKEKGLELAPYIKRFQQERKEKERKTT